MINGLNIPDEFQYTFKRLINLAPHQQRSDQEVQKMLLLYLKLGGEKLARQYIEVLKSDLRENEDRSEASEESDHAGDLFSDRNFSEDEDEDPEDED